jgi:hypothetical protein
MPLRFARSAAPFRAPAAVRLLALAALLVAVSGCGRSNRLPAFPVRGQVLYQGRPAGEALVIFHPVATAPEFADVRPTARVAADGSFTLTTYQANDGAPAGEYDVTIDWREHTAPVEGAPPGRSLLPSRYANRQLSKLHAQIKQGTNELEPFRLTR